MSEKKRSIIKRILLFTPLTLIILAGATYFLKPSLIVDFFHIGVDREHIKLEAESKATRDNLVNKWAKLEAAKRSTGEYPPFTLDSQEVQTFIQEVYAEAMPPEVKGIETSLDDSDIILRIKLNLEDYEKEIRKTGTPELAKMLKEDIVLSVRGGIEKVVGRDVVVDIKSVYFGFVPLPLSMIENIVNSESNVKKYNRKFDWKRYPLPKGINNLKIKDSILYVNQ